MSRPLLVTLFFLYFVVPMHAGWLERKAEGWAWYEDKAPPGQEKKDEKNMTASQKMDGIKKQLEEKLAQAILNPTPETVKAYMIEQKKWVDQSAHFSEVWAKILLANPKLDATITNPVSQYGIQTYKHHLQQQKEKLFKKLSQEYGLFFFYKGDCQFSQAFSQVVNTFVQTYQWQIIPITLDGVTLPAFPQTEKDNGIAKRFRLDHVPALFLVNPETNAIIPIAYGLVSMDHIEDNIMLQFQDQLEIKNVKN